MDLLSKLWISLRNWRYHGYIMKIIGCIANKKLIWAEHGSLTNSYGDILWDISWRDIYIYYMILYVWSLRTCLWIGYTGIGPQHYNELFNHWSFLYLICRRLELGIGIISAQSLDATLLCHRAMEGLPHRAAWQVSGGLGKKRNEVHLFLQ